MTDNLNLSDRYMDEDSYLSSRSRDALHELEESFGWQMVVDYLTDLHAEAVNTIVDSSQDVHENGLHPMAVALRDERWKGYVAGLQAAVNAPEWYKSRKKEQTNAE